MLFNSLDFAIFLPIVFILYWFVVNGSIKGQNILLLIASYVFYAWWDWRFLSLIAFSSLVDYVVANAMTDTDKLRKKRFLLWVSIIVNLGFLGFFKYYNFFLDSFVSSFSFFGVELQASSLNIILPVGISFYTFQTLSYTIDVYRGKIIPTKNFIAFSSFVSFFPQLVAGPIERATNLLPQFLGARKFDYQKAVDGMRQIIWGLFKKVVIADTCAQYANDIFNNSPEYSGFTLVLGALFFTFQIYCDFSGYSDIAIGTARLFGFNLMQNFAFPYFSRDIAEFWRRWHISLSTWFRDYLYIPLGGSRVGSLKKIRNVFAIFLVSGFWHGANWTFLAWGALNALYFLPLLLSNKNRTYTGPIAENSFLPNLKEGFGMFLTFSLTVFAWIFFRAESIGHALSYQKSMLVDLIEPTSFIEALDYVKQIGLGFFVVFGIFILLEWIGRQQQFAIERIDQKWHWVGKYLFYYALIIVIFSFSGEEQQFIYFQF